MEEKTKTIFERIGGIEAVDAAVSIFYNKVLEDERINHFFENTNMTAQVTKQKNFLAYVFGAPLSRFLLNVNPVFFNDQLNARYSNTFFRPVIISKRV